MLDVHPPHHPAHTWRDFFIHIATIVVGLLIAVGLEQAVEVAHHRHQRQELVRSLLEDTKRASRASEDYQQRVIDLRNVWTRQRIAQVRSAIFTRHPLPAATAYPSGLADVPDSPSWSAARSSGLLSVLSQDEVRSFGEAANLTLGFAPLSRDITDEFYKTQRFEQRFVVSTPPDRYDYSTATPADLKEYLDLLLRQQTALRRAELWLGYICGEDAAILEGSRDIEQIEKSEDRLSPRHQQGTP